MTNNTLVDQLVIKQINLFHPKILKLKKLIQMNILCIIKEIYILQVINYMTMEKINNLVLGPKNIFLIIYV